MAKPPAFQVYAKDWLTDGAELSLSEKGALSDLRAYAWHEGSIPDDDEKIARLLRATADEYAMVRSAVRARVVSATNGRLVFPDLEEQRAEMDAFRAEQKRKSALAVAAKQAKREPTGQPADAPADDSTGQPAGEPRGLPLHTPISDLRSASSPPPPALQSVSLRAPRAAAKRVKAKPERQKLPHALAVYVAAIVDGSGGRVPAETWDDGLAKPLTAVAYQITDPADWRAGGQRLRDGDDPGLGAVVGLRWVSAPGNLARLVAAAKANAPIGRNGAPRAKDPRRGMADLPEGF